MLKGKKGAGKSLLSEIPLPTDPMLHEFVARMRPKTEPTLTNPTVAESPARERGRLIAARKKKRAKLTPEEQKGLDMVLLDAAERVEAQMVKNLLDEGADVDARDASGKTALMLVSENGRTETARILIEGGAKVNLKDNDGRTALMLASREGRVEIAKLLIGMGTRVNVRDEHGQIALTFASEGGHAELIGLLKRHGAIEPKEPDRKAGGGWQGPTIASVVKMIADGSKKTLLEQDGRNKEVKEFLKAAQEGDAQKVMGFLENGIDVDAEDSNGETGLMKASRGGKFETVVLLIKEGADVNALNNEGWAPLMLACLNGSLEIVETLVSEGADVNAVNFEGWTALGIASAMGHKKIVEFLKKHGAKDSSPDKHRPWSSEIETSFFAEMDPQNKF